MNSEKSVNLVVLLLMAFTILFPTQTPYVHASVSRQVTIPVKVVFVGIDHSLVDTTYIKWEGNVPTSSYGEVYYPQPNVTGVQYNVDYSFVFASDSYKAKLVSYLQDIQQMRIGRNPWFFYYTVDESGYLSQRFYRLNYAVYDAGQVEEWMFDNQQDLGGFPTNGWTLMLLNLTDAIPSYDWANYKAFIGDYRQASPNGTAHYYGIQPRDLDLGYRYRYRDYMTGWGGVHRFWFDDLSAGPSFATYPEDLPLQIAIKDNNYDLHSAFGKNWFTEYLADYISQATINIVTPWYLYPPMYSEKYSFHVHIFDNRTPSEQAEVDIKSTFNPDAVKSSFEDLLPHSKVEVKTTFEDLSKYPELQNILRSNYKYSDSLTAGVDFGSPQQYGIIDARSVYKYLRENMQQFEPDYRRDRSEFTDPVFAFAFSNQTVFAWNYKYLIEPFGGVALGDLALIGSSQFDFQRGEYVSPIQPGAGIGLTYDVIHEAGHNLGLTHPHDPAGSTGDFTASPESYFTFDYMFGQRDKDALNRAYVDEIYQEVTSFLQSPSASNANAGQIQNQLKDTDAKYSQMDYVGALASVLKAESMMTSSTPVNNSWQPAAYLILGILVGIALALVVATPRGRRTVRGLFSSGKRK